MIGYEPGGGCRGSQCLLGSEVCPRLAEPDFGRDLEDIIQRVALNPFYCCDL